MFSSEQGYRHHSLDVIDVEREKKGYTHSAFGDIACIEPVDSSSPVYARPVHGTTLCRSSIGCCALVVSGVIVAETVVVVIGDDELSVHGYLGGGRDHLAHQVKRACMNGTSGREEQSNESCVHVGVVEVY